MRSFWQRISQQQSVNQSEHPKGSDGHIRQCLAPGLSPGPLGEWAGLANRGLSPFDSEFASVAGVLAPSPPQLPVLNKYFPESYLPIEALRDVHFGASLYCGKQVEREFRSSGTTASSRSTSRYSSAGLRAYRWASLYTFQYVLQQVLGVSPDSRQGFSLIPPVSVWPDSSLAQMVAWISEVCPVSYLQAERFHHVFTEAYRANAKPVWLFATAFHLVDLIDSGNAKPLPPGSVIIETGGTKGKSRSVTRDELYAMIEKALGVPSHKIISEYGMCELASQAYDFIAPLEQNKHGQRCFRFPAWVQISVISERERAESSGNGALLVSDPLRIDHPWPIRTEDLANLENSKGLPAFRLLGRLDRAPLKGCSLLAERADPIKSDLKERVEASIVGQKSVENFLTQVPGSLETSNIDDPRLNVRAEDLGDALGRWLGERAPLMALAAELGSQNAAKAAIEDLCRSLPTDSRGLVAAAVRAQGRGIPRRWMFILPSSHSLVGLYPLAMGYILGLQIRIRISAGLDQETSFIKQFVSLIQSLPDAHIAVAPSSFRIDLEQPLQDVDAVLAYGEDETLEHLARLAGKVPVKGFGGRVGISILSAPHCDEELPLVVRDALTLGQRGCMATRLILVLDEACQLVPDSLAEQLIAATKGFWQGSVPWQAKVALDAEYFRYRRLGFESPSCLRDHSWPLVVFKEANSFSGSGLGGPEIMARVPHTFPVVVMRGLGWDEFLLNLPKQLDYWPSLASCSLSPKFVQDALVAMGQKHFLRLLGRANAPLWDGTHEGLPLFDGPVLS